MNSDDDQWFCDEDPEPLEDGYEDYLSEPDEPPEQDDSSSSACSSSEDEDEGEGKQEEDCTSSEGALSLGAHPIFSKYFKMRAVGMPREMVLAKMRQDGVDVALLDMDPSACAPEEVQAVVLGSRRRAHVHHTPAPSASTSTSAAVNGDGAVSVGAAHGTGAVPAAPGQRGGAPPPPPAPTPTPTPPSVDAPPSAAAPADAPAAAELGEMVPAGEHPVYGKYFKMMKVRGCLFAMHCVCLYSIFLILFIYIP